MKERWIISESLSTKDVTLVKVSTYVEIQNHILEIDAVGVAKRDPKDRARKEIGYNLAFGRALENLGKKIEKKANGLVKHNDDMRQAHKEISTKKSKKKSK